MTTIIRDGKFTGYTLTMVHPTTHHDGGGYIVGGWLVVTIATRA